MTLDDEMKLERFRQKCVGTSEADKAAVEISIATLKMLFLANGAAAIACLTFVGNTSSAGHYLKLSNIVEGTKIFCIGAFCAMLAAGLGYIYQSFLTELRDVRAHDFAKLGKDEVDSPRARKLWITGKWIICLALLSAIAALASFLFGILYAAQID